MFNELKMNEMMKVNGGSGVAEEFGNMVKTYVDKTINSEYRPKVSVEHHPNSASVGASVEREPGRIGVGVTVGTYTGKITFKI